MNYKLDAMTFWCMQEEDAKAQERWHRSKAAAMQAQLDTHQHSPAQHPCIKAIQLETALLAQHYGKLGELYHDYAVEIYKSLSEKEDSANKEKEDK